MNLSKLFEMQKALDERIEKEHPRQDGEDRLYKKILALQVELGELCQEWRGFKFWSKDQEPRNFCLACQLTETSHVCKNPLLEEYVDCLHFILSIGLEIGVEYFRYHPSEKYKSNDISKQFIWVMEYTLGLLEDDYCMELLSSFVHLGEQLGFTWEQIEFEYLRKNVINHERQANNY